MKDCIYYGKDICPDKCPGYCQEISIDTKRYALIKLLIKELDNVGLYENGEPICTLIMPAERIEGLADKIIKVLEEK